MLYKNIINHKKYVMKNEDETINEKPKGNMLQNENREDEASPENSSGEQQENQTKEQDENVIKNPALKTEKKPNKP